MGASQPYPLILGSVWMWKFCAKQTTSDVCQRWKQRASKESFPEVKQCGNYNTQSILVTATAKTILKLSISMIMFKWGKKECVGHVQKRIGTALQKLKKENKGIGGKGKLTDTLNWLLGTLLWCKYSKPLVFCHFPPT